MAAEADHDVERVFKYYRIPRPADTFFRFKFTLGRHPVGLPQAFNLPDEVVLGIVSHLDLRSRFMLASTSHHFRSVVHTTPQMHQVVEHIPDALGLVCHSGCADKTSLKDLYDILQKHGCFLCGKKAVGLAIPLLKRFCVSCASRWEVGRVLLDEAADWVRLPRSDIQAHVRVSDFGRLKHLEQTSLLGVRSVQSELVVSLHDAVQYALTCPDGPSAVRRNLQQKVDETKAIIYPTPSDWNEICQLRDDISVQGLDSFMKVSNYQPERPWYLAQQYVPFGSPGGSLLDVYLCLGCEYDKEHNHITGETAFGTHSDQTGLGGSALKLYSRSELLKHIVECRTARKIAANKIGID